MKSHKVSARRLARRGVIVAGFAIAGVAVSARQNPPSPASRHAGLPPSTAGHAASSPDDHLTGDDLVWNAKTDIVMARNLKYTEGETTVIGSVARYNSRTMQLDASGGLTLDDPQHHVTGATSHVDRKSRLAVITGQVVIVLKSKPAAGASAGGPASAPVAGNSAAPPPAPDDAADVSAERGRGGTITCDRVEDYYKKEFIKLSGHLVFHQTIRKDNGQSVERVLIADHADYDGKANTMLLYAPVNGHDSEGQQVEFVNNVTVGTKEGEETITSKGKYSAVFTLDSADKPDGSKPVAPGDGKPPTDAKTGGHSEPH